MNKKLMVLIIVLFLSLSLVVISLLGTIPMEKGKKVTDIVFLPSDEHEIGFFDEDSKYSGLLNVKIDLLPFEEPQEGQNFVVTYVMTYKVEPNNVTNNEVKFAVKDPLYNDYVSFEEVENNDPNPNVKSVKIIVTLPDKSEEEIEVVFTASDSSGVSNSFVLTLYEKRSETVN